MCLCGKFLVFSVESFLGREKELGDIAGLLSNPVCRLLTLVGPGGIGKTRLALQAAAENAHAFRHGVCLVPLAALSSADLLVRAIASTLKLSFQTNQEHIEQLGNHLRDKEMLLVLDNFEHLLPGVGFLSKLLKNALQVKLLVTSREHLNLQWEWLFQVRGLNFPQGDEVATAENYSAVQLFLQSAQRVQRGAAPSAGERSHVVRICQFLEGMPLGIELAATWTQALSCQEIAEEIERGLSFLATTMHDVPERHRSLQATFDHSWNLLQEEDRTGLNQLSVFRGGFSREAAGCVAQASLKTLMTLVRKSFLTWNTTGRYEMLEVLRQYALEKLQETPQTKVKAYDKHCEYYAAFLHEREAHLRGSRRKEALEEIGAEIENVRAAWSWAVAQGRVQAISQSLRSLAVFYETQGWFREGEQILKEALAGLGGAEGGIDPSDRKKAIVLARTLVRLGRLYRRLDRVEEARALLQQSLSTFRQLDARREMTYALRVLGTVVSSLEEHEQARQLYQESLAFYQARDDRMGVAKCLNNLGVVALRLAQLAEASELLHKGLSICREMENQSGIALCLGNLGLISERKGRFHQAKELQQECLALYQEIGEQWGIANCFNNLGFVEYELGNDQQAKSYFQQALKIALDTHVASVTWEALLGIAALLAREKQYERALELVVHVLDRRVISPLIRYRAKQLLSELEARLSLERVASIRARNIVIRPEQFLENPWPG